VEVEIEISDAGSSDEVIEIVSAETVNNDHSPSGQELAF
jgi:hypothetical protein